MDPRLRDAVSASVSWYDDVFAAHDIAVSRAGGLWTSVGPAPAWHSVVKTLEPGVDAGTVLEAMEPHGQGSVADSFGDLHLAPYGFELLIDATWVSRPPDGNPRPSPPAGWSVLDDPRALTEWNALHETTGVLLPSLLEHPHFTFLAHHEEEVLTAGAVIHNGTSAAGLSISWAAPGHDLDWLGVIACVGVQRPGCTVVDYAWGDDLARLLEVGFSPVGPHRVWAR
jgi:hypothetical protein